MTVITNRLRIAIQKSGRLSQDSQALLTSCGLKINLREQRLIAHVENMDIDLLRVRDDDIPGLVMDGVCDLGFVGENVLEEVSLQRQMDNETYDYTVLARLDFGGCRLSIAVPQEEDYKSIKDLEGRTIATTYPRLLNRYLKQNGVNCRIVNLKGSVEVAPRAGLADAICDLVSTGATLEANGLKEVEVIYRSKAVLIQRRDLADEKQLKLIKKLMPRIQGVMQAENPTLLPLAGNDDLVALHVVSSETLFWETMEQLKGLGASSILVLPIEKMME